MPGARISEVARRSGLPASTIRYYETQGLVSPAVRDANGYRSYSDADVDRLSFLAAAKRLDLGLDELRQLVAAQQSEMCAHVQRDMHTVVNNRLAETEARISELQRVADDLRRTEERLAGPALGGACSDACACAAIVGDSVQAPEGVTVWEIRSR